MGFLLPSKDEYYNFVCDFLAFHLEFVESEEGKKVEVLI